MIRVGAALVVNLIALAYYVGGAVLAGAVIADNQSATRAHAELAGFRSAEEQTDTLIRRSFESLTLGLYRGATEKARTIEDIAERARHHERRARSAALALAGASVVLVVVLLATLRTDPGARRLMFHLLGISALCLVVGVSAPVLTVSAQAEIAVLGEVVLQHDTKGIIGTVVELALKERYFLAGLLGLFSIVAPVVKLALSMTAIAVRHLTVRRLSIGTVDLIGKWSMTDVFVVAILLAFLATGGDGFTRAALGPGLYFFAAYGIISLVVGQMIGRHARELTAGREHRA